MAIISLAAKSIVKIYKIRTQHAQRYVSDATLRAYVAEATLDAMREHIDAAVSIQAWLDANKEAEILIGLRDA